MILSNIVRIAVLAIVLALASGVAVRGFFDRSKSLEARANRHRIRESTTTKEDLPEELVEEESVHSIGNPVALPDIDMTELHSLRPVEQPVLQATRNRTLAYFGARVTVGTPVQEPFLCFMLLTKMKEYRILKRNMAVFGARCHWAIAANFAHDLTIDSTEMHKFLKENDVKVVREDYRLTVSYLVKTRFWKDVVLEFHGKYSHVWFLDGDIAFTDRPNLDSILNDWLCGSVGGFPPLISQPMVKAVGHSQDYQQVNYFHQYGSTNLSVVGTDVIENQVVFADMNFLYWLFSEVIEPYFEKEPEFSVTAWGLSRTWCGAAKAYIQEGVRYYSTIENVPQNGATPLACAILTHPVLHASTRGLNKTSFFLRAGRTMIQKLEALFPTWSEDFIRENRYPSGLLELAANIKRASSRGARPAISPIEYVTMRRNKSVCGARNVAFGRYRSMRAYAWV